MIVFEFQLAGWLPIFDMNYFFSIPINYKSLLILLGDLGDRKIGYMAWATSSWHSSLPGVKSQPSWAPDM
jgi:hypothetical protein